MTWCYRKLAAVPDSLLSLSLLPRPHRHRSIVRPRHFLYHMFLDFRHGLLSSFFRLTWYSLPMAGGLPARLTFFLNPKQFNLSGWNFQLPPRAIPVGTHDLSCVLPKAQ